MSIPTFVFPPSPSEASCSPSYYFWGCWQRCTFGRKKLHAGTIIIKSRRERRLPLPAPPPHLMQRFVGFRACCLEQGAARMSVFHSLNVIIGRQQELSGGSSALLVTHWLNVSTSVIRLWLRLHLRKSPLRRKTAFFIFFLGFKWRVNVRPPVSLPGHSTGVLTDWTSHVFPPHRRWLPEQTARPGFLKRPWNIKCTVVLRSIYLIYVSQGQPHPQ